MVDDQPGQTWDTAPATAKVPKKGPYLNEDGDWWVAVEDVKSYTEARNAVVSCLDYSIPTEGALAYKGIEQARLCDASPPHDVGPACDAECTRIVKAYHFEEHRRW